MATLPKGATPLAKIVARGGPRQIVLLNFFAIIPKMHPLTLDRDWGGLFREWVCPLPLATRALVNQKILHGQHFISVNKKS